MRKWYVYPVVVLSAAVATGCGRRTAKNKDTEMRELVSKLGTPPWMGISHGGPYHVVLPNETTGAIISKGKAIVPYLIEALEDTPLEQTIYILDCLILLRAPAARERVLQLKRDVDEGRRFAGVKRDYTLDWHIGRYLEVTAPRDSGKTSLEVLECPVDVQIGRYLELIAPSGDPGNAPLDGAAPEAE